MLQDGSGFVLFDSFWHHVQDVMHNGCPQLQVKVRLHTLLCDSLCYALGVTAWKEQSTSAVLTLPGSAPLSSQYRNMQRCRMFGEITLLHH